MTLYLKFTTGLFCLLLVALDVTSTMLQVFGTGVALAQDATSDTYEWTVTPAASLVSGGAVDIQAALGFTETFRLERWTPLTVTVSNRGNDLRGQLEVEMTGGDALQGDLFTTFQRRDLELPRDSRKRFHFTVFLDNPSKPLIIRVSSAGRELARRTINLRGRSTTSRLILVLSRDADLDSLNDSSGETLRVLYPHPELLPDHWQGYDGVAAVVIHGMSLEQLSARQFQSLKKWLARGGVLAISGGPDYALLRTPRLAELVPAVPLGIAQVSDAAVVSEGLRAPIDAPQSFDVHRLVRLQGRVLYRADEFPLIIEQDRGRGRVLYLTFDIARFPFASWSGMRPLWLESLRLPPPSPMSFYPAAPELASPVPAVIRKGPAEFPQHFTVLIFLVLYLGILTTGYHLAATTKTSRWLLPWLTWASPLIFAPAAYLLFGPLLFPNGATAIMLSIIEPFPRSPYAHLRLDLGVYSNRRSELRFEYEGAEPVFRPARQTPPRTENWVFRQGVHRSLRPADKREYVLHLLQGQDIVVHNLDGSVVETEAGPRLHLRNDSGRPLNHAWLLFKDSVYPLGSIAEDAEVKRDFNAGTEALGLQRLSSREILLESDGSSSVRDRHAAEIVLERTLEELREEQEHGRALLLGFSRSPLRLGGATRSWRRTELALVLFRLPVTRLSIGQEQTD